MNLSIGTQLFHRKSITISGEKVCDIDDESLNLCDEHALIIKYFNDKTNGKRLASRQDLQPFDMVASLPFITLFDIFYDKKGMVADLQFRLQGTSMVDFYGEWTGRSILKDDGKECLKSVYPETYERLISIAQTALDKRKPFVFCSKQVSQAYYYLTIESLVVPMSDDGENINILFTHSSMKTTTQS